MHIELTSDVASYELIEFFFSPNCREYKYDVLALRTDDKAH